MNFVALKPFLCVNSVQPISQNLKGPSATNEIYIFIFYLKDKRLLGLKKGSQASRNTILHVCITTISINNNSSVYKETFGMGTSPYFMRPVGLAIMYRS